MVNGATGESLEDIIADNIAQMNELVVKNNKIDADYAEMKSFIYKIHSKSSSTSFLCFC